jgi:hypothetical protein
MILARRAPSWCWDERFQFHVEPAAANDASGRTERTLTTIAVEFEWTIAGAIRATRP